MYSLMVNTKFIAQHFLIGKDFGSENLKHSHQYSLEIEIESPVLDQYNYLLDIVEVQNILHKLTEYFKNKTLNELAEFDNQNPSIEFFAKVIWEKFTTFVKLTNNCQITVRLREDDIAQASYREFKKC